MKESKKLKKEYKRKSEKNPKDATPSSTNRSSSTVPAASVTYVNTTSVASSSASDTTITGIAPLKVLSDVTLLTPEQTGILANIDLSLRCIASTKKDKVKVLQELVVYKKRSLELKEKELEIKEREALLKEDEDNARNMTLK